MYKLFSMLEDLDKIPNVPFFTSKVSEALIRICKDIGINEENASINEDFLGVSVTIKAGKPNKRIILCSHLDHPGFVFNGNGIGRPLGSVGGIGNLGLSKINKPSDMDFYSKEGKYVGRSDVRIENGRIFCENLNLKKNTVGIWHIENTSFSSPTIKMRSADNHVSTATILYTVSEIINSLKDTELILLFTSVEEVFQMSMTGMCIETGIAGRKINKDDLFVVLETMEIEPYNSSVISYSGGPLIKVNDAEVPYGVASRQKVNKSESMLLEAAVNLKHQHGFSSGHTDALALSLMTDCPNIVTLAIPCQNKHNVTSTGEITTEDVKTQDIDLSITILKKLLKCGYIGETNEILSTKTTGNLKGLQGRKIERILKYKQNKPRLLMGFYYPENILHWLLLAKARFI